MGEQRGNVGITKAEKFLEGACRTGTQPSGGGRLKMELSAWSLESAGEAPWSWDSDPIGGRTMAGAGFQRRLNEVGSGCGTTTN